MPNQRPPNSAHHENALQSDVSINGTHTIFERNPTEARGTRETNTQQHTSQLMKNCSARKRRQFNKSKGGMPKTPKSEIAQKNAPSLAPSPPPLPPPHTHTLTKQTTQQRSSTASAKDICVASSNHHVPKKPCRSTCEL